MLDNVIPYIGGEEEKSEQEPLKLWGHIEDGKIVDATEPNITAQCLRVPVSDGHMAACFVSFKGEKPSIEQIKADWAAFSGRAQELNLPSAPAVPALLRGKPTVRRRNWTACSRAVWPYLSGGCAIRSTITNLSACPIIPCVEQLAAQFCWQNCFARKDISQRNNPEGSDSLKKPIFEGALRLRFVTPFKAGYDRFFRHEPAAGSPACSRR